MKHLRRDYSGAGGLMSSLELGQSSSQIPPEAPRTELSELLAAEPSRPKSSVLFKLTDECSAAIQEAIKKNYRVRLNYTKNSCTVEVGYNRKESEVKRFTCVVQSIGFPMDVLCINNGVHRNISSLNSKIQVRATEKTFAETREKAQKMVEEQQKRKTMDMGQKFSKRPLMPKRQSTGAPISASLSSKKPIAPPIKSSYQVSSNTPNPTQKFSKNGILIKPSNALAPASKPNRTSLPEKTVESPSTIAANSSPIELAPIVAAKTRIALVPKTTTSPIIPIISPNTISSNSKSISPSSNYTASNFETKDHPAFRKRPFSTRNTNSTKKVTSPSLIASETKRRNIEHGSLSFSSNLVNNVNNYENSASSAAIFNGASVNVLQPPVYQPTSTKKLSTVIAVGTPVVVGAASSTSSSSSLTPDENLNRFHQRGSLTQPTKSSRDWSQTFGDIQNFSDAKKYHEIFKTEYSEYFKCYKALSKVAKEFSDLEKSLKSMQMNTPDYDKMEEAIHLKFAKYQQDEVFLNRRQKHTDLRAKLDILKQRIGVWEKNARQNGLKNMETNNDQLKQREALKTKAQQDSDLSSIDHMMLM